MATCPGWRDCPTFALHFVTWEPELHHESASEDDVMFELHERAILEPATID